MSNATAKAVNYNEQKHRAASENTALHLRYRQIGISAVAAAVRYQGSGKNPAYAPSPIKSSTREAAAS
jgi:hypothetical protein